MTQSEECIEKYFHWIWCSMTLFMLIICV